MCYTALNMSQLLCCKHVFHNVHGKCRSRQLRQLVLICSDKSGGGGWWGRSRGALGSVAKGYAIGGALLGAAYLIASACKK